jgi:transcriptional regulator with XRE-family HTH domain
MATTAPKLGTTFQNVFGVVVTDLRSSRDPAVTQTELADSLGLAVSTWSRIERGESAMTLDQMLRVAIFFRTPLSDLLLRCEKVVKSLNEQGVEVSISKDALRNEFRTLPLNNAQILGMALPALGPIGWAAIGAFESYKFLNGILFKKNAD